MSDPNYQVSGLPPAILGKISEFQNAVRDAAFAGSNHPDDAETIREHVDWCRYQLERTIKTYLEGKGK